MDRRTFIKGIMLSVPALSVLPMSFITADLKMPKVTFADKRLSIVFIGPYGTRVSGRFRSLVQSEPVYCSCAHLPEKNWTSIQWIDWALEHFSKPDWLMRLLCCDTAVLVFNDRDPRDHALVNSLCALLKRTGSACMVLGLTPFLSSPTGLSKLDLALVTCQNHIDFTPYVLLTVFKAYVACARLGNLLCLKVQLQDLLYENYSRAILLFHKTVRHIKEIDLTDLFLVTENPHSLFPADKPLQLVWFIVEMHHGHRRPFAVIGHLTENDPFNVHNRLVLPHLSLAQHRYRVTMFGLN